MKKKILFFGWDHHEIEVLRKQMQKWVGKYEIVFAKHDTHALAKLTESKMVYGNTINSIVFKRNSLVVQTDVCRLIARFAEYLIEFGQPKFVPINLIYNDQDIEGRDSAVSAYFAKEGDWEQVFTIIENHFKS